MRRLLLLSLLTATVAAASAPRTSVAVLWRDPGDIASKDLYWGPGSADGAPKPPFRFLKEEGQGARPKILVRDGAGVEWQVKFRGSPSGNEVNAEVAASRLLWALGYFVEELYYVPEGRIEGARGDDPEYEMGPDGTFRAARFEKRPRDVEFLSDIKWSFAANPFRASREMSGLQILLTMINAWDNGGSRNTMVLGVKRPDGTLEDRYMISDLGSAFGLMGKVLEPRSRWNLAQFRGQKFIDGVADGKLDLHYNGDGEIDEVSIEHARWFASLVSRLAERQIRAAFEAAGATPEEIDGFTARLMAKSQELQRAVAADESARRD